MYFGRNVFFQKWLKVVFTWGPATYSLLLAHTHTQLVNEGNMDQTSIGAKLQEASLALQRFQLISGLQAMLETKDMLQLSLGRVHTLESGNVC